MISSRHPTPLFLLLIFAIIAVIGVPSYSQEMIREKAKPLLNDSPGKEKIRLEIVGVSDQVKNNIRDVLGDRVGFLLTPPASRAEASDLAFILENFMRDQGYPDVEIFWRVESPNHIRLRIETGRIVTIGNVLIKGAGGITENDDEFNEELKDILLAKTKTREQLNDQGTPYVPEDLALGIENIRTLLQSRGYWNAEIAMTTADDSETGGKSITLTIEPGKLIKIGTIDFQGLVESELSMVNPMADSVKGEVATADRLIDFEQRIRAAFDRQGFYDTTVRFSQTISKGLMALVVAVYPGRQVTIGDIIIRKTGRTDKEVILERLEPYKNKYYDPDTISEAIDELYKTGVFERIEVDEFVEPDDTIDLEISLEEANARSLGFYAGMSSETGYITGINYSHLNVGGRLHQFRSVLEYSALGARGDASYTIPWFVIDHSNASFRVFGITRDYAAYDKLEYGWEHSLTYPFTDNYSAAFRVGGSYISTSGLAIDRSLAGQLDYYVSYVGITQTYDDRDDQVNPRKGLIASLQLDAAGSWIGSDINFSRAIARGAYYFPIGESSHIKLAAASGVIHSDEQLPIDLRFFHGGASNVRSFRERRGPPFSDSGKPVGGNAFNYGSVEFVGPIAGPVKFVVFTDAGNVIQDTDPLNFDDIELAVGAGIRINLPTGPIRFEYGYNATHDKGEPEGTFQFVIGVTF